MDAPNNSGAVTPNSPAQSATRGNRWWHAKCPAQPLVPLPASDIEQHRARGIGGIGRVHLAAGEAPQQKAVDGAEGKPAGLRQGTRAVHVVEQPGDLAGGKIRIEQQPRLGRDLRLMAACAQRIAKIGGAAVLPDDGIVDGLAGGAIPDNRGLALIGYADAGDVLGRQAGFRDCRAHRRDRRRPDLLRIVLDLARRGINLAQFLLRAGERLQRRIKRDGARRSRTLVDGDESGRQRKVSAMARGD